MKRHASATHGLTPQSSEHTGVFLSDTQKLGSIGVQVRHRLTTHGLAINITQEPIAWFDQVVACGLDDVKAVSIAGASGKEVNVDEEVYKLAQELGTEFARELVPLVQADEEIYRVVRGVEDIAVQAGPWLPKPLV